MAVAEIRRLRQLEGENHTLKQLVADLTLDKVDQPPVVRPPVQFAHADKPIGVTMRVFGAGGRYPSALCGRRVLN